MVQNDKEIFDYVRLKIAMGNATPELKEKADYVTGTVEEDGISMPWRNSVGEKNFISHNLTWMQ